MCFDQVVETGVSCHVCAGEEVSGNLLRFSKMCPGGIFKNVSRGNAFDFEDFEDFCDLRNHNCICIVFYRQT